MADYTRREFIGISAGLAALPALAQDAEGLVVHEWGVVTAAYGAAWAKTRGAGATRDGANERPATLPAFVKTWRGVVGEAIEEWKNAPVLVDKPVLYFYASKPTTLSLRVDVPSGRPEAWWPPAADWGPKPEFPRRAGGKALGDPTPDPEPPKVEQIPPVKGFLHWPSLSIEPEGARPPKEDGWWERARLERPALVRAARPAAPEKFLFYDALTPFDPRVEIDWQPKGVTIKNTGRLPLGRLFAIRVRQGECASASVASLEPGASASLAPAPGAPREFADALVAAGLYAPEAQAIEAIWREEFFAVDGVRVLFVVPRATYDELLPLTIKPAPREFVRVLVAHVECADEERRAQYARWIEQLESSDLDERTAAEAKLRSAGSLAEGSIRQAIGATKDAEAKARLEALLKGR